MLTVLTAIGAWLYTNTVGNLVASLIAFGTAYLWKIRPHLRAQAAHRKHVDSQLTALHKAVNDA